MKRSALKRGTSQLKRSAFKRPEFPARNTEAATGLKIAPEPILRQRKPIRTVGRRSKEWRRVWDWLKPRLEKAHRTQCEFDFIPHNCFGPLDPAHSKKRNKMQGDDIYAVAIACRNIHRVLDEVYTHTAMEKAVMYAINRSGGLILPDA